MIDIYYTRFKRQLDKSLFNKYLKLIPNELKEKNSRYMRWQDQHSHLFGKLLLLEGLKKYNYSEDVLYRLHYNEYSRPYLTGNIDFNISHSGQFVVCAIGKSVRLGIDIEEIKNISFDDFEKVMTNEQWELIKIADDPLKMFFKFWTIKESVIKADSRGLSIPLLDIKVIDNKVSYENNTWYLQDLSSIHEKYCACLAINKPNSNLRFLEINYNSLIS